MADRAGANLTRLLLLVLVLAGIGLRLKFALGFSLTTDEVRSAFQALHPDFSAFWWRNIEHSYLYFANHILSVSLLGHNLLAARLPSLILGTALIGLLFASARRLGGEGAGLWAAFLAAFNFELAGWSSIFTAHVLWLFYSGLFIWLALKVSGGGRPWYLLLLVLTPLAQHSAWPILFVQAGLAALLFYRGLKPGGAGRARFLRPAGYAVLVLLTGLFLLWTGTGRLARYGLANPTVSDYAGMGVYWNQLGPAGGLRAILNQGLTALAKFLPFVGQAEAGSFFTGLGLFTALVGLSDLARREEGRELLVLLAGTLACQLLAVVLSLWPLHWRHSLYLAPFYLLAVAQGITVLGGWLKERRLWPAFALGLVLLSLLPLRAALKTPFVYGEAGPLEWGSSPFLARLEEEARDGDAVFADGQGGRALVFLTFDRNPGLAKEIFSAQDRKRVWPLRLEKAEVRLLLGGADLEPLLEARPERIWVLLTRTAKAKERRAAEALPPAGYELVRERTMAPPPDPALWRLYRRQG